MGFEIEHLPGKGRPCILYDYPAPMASLAKLKPGDEKLAQRFELYAAGIALGVDRMVMLFCNAVRIDEVVAFAPDTL